MPKSCVPDIDVIDPQTLDPIDMYGKCVNPHEAVKEALTTKTAGPRTNPTPSAGGTVPRSPVTPRPDEMHSICNCMGAYVHQVPL